MTIGEAWRAIRRDPEWMKKLGLASLVMLIPYVGTFLVIGYGLTYQREVAWSVDKGLPEWKDLGRFANKAIGAFAVSLVWSVPLLGVGLLWLIGIMAALFATPDWSPVPVFVAIAVGYAVFLVALFAWIPVSLSALLQFTLYDDIPAALRVRDILGRMRGNRRILLGVSLRAIALYLIPVAVVFGSYVLMFIALLGLARLGENAPLLIIPAFYLMPILSLVVAVPLSVLTTMMVYHMFGAYGRVAYGLEPPSWATA